MNIQKNHVVSLHYVLTEDHEQGEFLEETYGEEPLQFIFGVGMMLPTFEDHLENLKKGDHFKFILEPEDAYGDYEESAVVEMDLSKFEDADGNIDAERLKPGAPINLSDPEGRTFHGVIAEVKTESIVVDFNHPMSGRTLHFKGEILDVRPATPSELDHGHVHPNGEEHN